MPRKPAREPAYVGTVALYCIHDEQAFDHARSCLARAGAFVEKVTHEDGWARFAVTSRLPRRQLLEALHALGARI